MMKIAIDKAWEENLKLDKEDQYKNKDEIIDSECVCNCCFDIPLGQPKYCTDGDDNEICTKCWNREIEEDDTIQENNREEIKESKFEQLKQSPIEFIRLDDDYEQETIISLKDNSEIVWTGSDSKITYDKIPELVAWFQSVYNYCTELKNKVEYVDFTTAKEHMKDGNNAYYNGAKYNINDVFTIDAIESDKWILDKKEGEKLCG